jgi:tetratricopeptide (TPR) repeat protein
MGSRYFQRFALLVTVNVAMLMSLAARAQDADPIQAGASAATTIVGPRNQPLYDGAQAIQAGSIETGVRLTLEGLSLAEGRREEEAALTNLCTGYLRLRQFDAALKYCNMLLQRNENAWRGYNSRAMIYLEQEAYEKADEDLKRAEAINPGAQTLKVARALYMDAVHPVAPAVEIDDRQNRQDPDNDR